MIITSDEQYQEEYAKLSTLDPDVAGFIAYAWAMRFDAGLDLYTVDEMINWYNERQPKEGDGEDG